MELKQAVLNKALARVKAATGGAVAGRPALRGFEHEAKVTLNDERTTEWLKAHAGEFGLQVPSHYEPQFVRLLDGD